MSLDSYNNVSKEDKLLLDNPKINTKHALEMSFYTVIGHNNYQILDLMLRSKDIDSDTIVKAFETVTNHLVSQIWDDAVNNVTQSIYSRILSDPRLNVSDIEVQNQIMKLIEVIEEYKRIDLLVKLLREPKIKYVTGKV